MDALAQRLRQERERQNLSVHDLAAVTKIREPYIHAVERGAYDVLPAVYVRSFVRTLGTSLGIAVSEINQLMDDVFDVDEGTQDRIPRSKPPEPERPDLLASSVQVAGQALSTGAQKAGRALSESVDRLKDLAPPTFFRERSRALVYVGAAIVALLLAAGVWWMWGGSSIESDSLGQPDNEIDVGGLVDSLMDVDPALADSMELRAEVLDTAWLTITMDGVRTQQLVLLPETEHHWRAAEAFKLSLSNAGAVRFFRNDRALPLFGQVGQAVREVVISRTDVRSSTSTVGAQQQAVQQQATPPATQQRPRSRNARRTQQQNRNSIPLITPAPTQNPNVRRDPPR